MQMVAVETKQARWHRLLCPISAGIRTTVYIAGTRKIPRYKGSSVSPGEPTNAGPVRSLPHCEGGVVFYSEVKPTFASFSLAFSFSLSFS